MAAILGKAWQFYQLIFEEFADRRTESWPFVAKPYQGLALLAVYLMFVFKWGPAWMKNRQPFNLEKVLIVFNLVQVIANTYLFVNSVWYAWGWKYKWICEPVDSSFSESAVREARLVYFYYLLKILDLLDTVFFVLRKKFNQVSFLHVYHHTGMVMLCWGAITYYPGGHGTLIGVINAFVHIIMYSYYLITVAKPSLKESLWWKKYITQLQIVQFFWYVVHMGIIVFYPDCAYPRWVAAIFLPQNLFMLILFVDFYIKAYVKKPKSKATLENNKDRRKGYDNHVEENVLRNGVSSSKEKAFGHGITKEHLMCNGGNVVNGHDDDQKKVQ